jgi:Outer membrane lipoprotein-sorting protein
MRNAWFIALLLSCTLLSAQEPSTVLGRLMAANQPQSLQARFTQTRHTPLLEENLVSEGRVYMQAPDRIRWETTSPVKKVSVLNDDAAGRRFRLPAEKDFSCTVMSGEGELALMLIPLRRDLKQMMTQAVVKADPATLQVRSILLRQEGGSWTLIEFKDVKTDVPLDASLFAKQE